ncbi:hypothetical protein B9L23_08225 [Parageobacillus galactosidasius]|uniref:Uncharacterized protein n=2 Tax=Parageobacillus galactosidasius TaxID=883812 RepID=A0A226QSG4_9BACL|nr:hypothetical protein B9L23_08225 [Parageobacillus galactosidasius]
MLPIKEGDTVFIQSDCYTGHATITYIDYQSLYNHHAYPVQVEIKESDLDKKLDDFNSGQRVFRVNLKEIVGLQESENTYMDGENNLAIDDKQMSLFDI